MTCPLCEIPKKEKLIFEDDLLYLVSTKEMKGHKVRVMVALKRHSEEPTFEERIMATFLLNKYMEETMRQPNSYHYQPWFLVGNSHATIRNHWHLIACDAETADSKEAEQLKITEKVEFPLFLGFGEQAINWIPTRNARANEK
jgi:hypothetical protein